MGGSIRNGELLERAEANFDLFITSDQDIHQQNLPGTSYRHSGTIDQ